MTASPNGNARWGMWASVAAALAVILGGALTFYLRAESGYQKALALEERVSFLEKSVQASQTDISVIHADMREIDTQLRASIDDKNLSHAWDLRVESVLWEQAFKGHSHLPIDNAVYPNIADGKSR